MYVHRPSRGLMWLDGFNCLKAAARRTPVRPVGSTCPSPCRCPALLWRCLQRSHGNGSCDQSVVRRAPGNSWRWLAVVGGASRDSGLSTLDWIVYLCVECATRRDVKTSSCDRQTDSARASVACSSLSFSRRSTPRRKSDVATSDA